MEGSLFQRGMTGCSEMFRAEADVKEMRNVTLTRWFRRSAIRRLSLVPLCSVRVRNDGGPQIGKQVQRLVQRQRIVHITRANLIGHEKSS